MTVVEADGNYVEPVVVDDLDIYSGESYSVLITTDQNPSANYWVSISVRGRLPKTQPGLTILNYHPNSPSQLPTSPTSKASSNKILARQGSPKPPPFPARRIFLLNTQNYIDGYTKWAINNISLILPPTPYLGSIKFGLRKAIDQERPPDMYPSNYDVMRPPANPNSKHGSNVYMLKFNSTVDVILQNANGKADEKKLNLKNPPLQNTAVVFPYGWTALRFISDNPVVWAFHCHIEPHLHMGMGVIFAEGVELVKNIPTQALACGMTANMFINGHHRP
ncbi:hypothetical protein ACLOJK_014676 [Asimina triloba]